MGTPFDEIYLDFQVNMTGVDLTGKEALIFQAFKRSVAMCEKTVQKSLTYILAETVCGLKIYELSDKYDRIIISINDSSYSVTTKESGDKKAVLSSLLRKIKGDYPLSNLEGEVLYIMSENSVTVKILRAGGFRLILEPSYDGEFLQDLQQDEISLIAAGMTSEWYKMQHSRVCLERNNMGTKHFDKDPDRKKQYDGMVERSKYWDTEFYRLRQEFYSYGGN